MTDSSETHCRLCAVPTAFNHAVSTDDETGIKSGLKSKLQWLCVDVAPSNLLPKCVCYVCFDVLTRTWSFIHQVKEAQKKLAGIYGDNSRYPKEETLRIKSEPKPESRESKEDMSESSISESDCEPSKKMVKTRKTKRKLKPEELVVEVDLPGIECEQKSRRKKASKSEITCKICNREFQYPCMLNRHNKAVHTVRKKDFTCHVCGMMFYTKHTMAAHLLTHEEAKPFKCIFCPLAFRARRNLKTHLLTHSANKPFSCETCGKSFLNQTYLKRHSIIHTDLMPFECEVCHKKFRRLAKLQVHLRQHTGVKPYRCEICARDFTNWSNHYKHMKRRHNATGKKEKVIIENLNIQNIPMMESTEDP